MIYSIPWTNETTKVSIFRTKKTYGSLKPPDLTGSNTTPIAPM
jgi:hypothetical protein